MNRETIEHFYRQERKAVEAWRIAVVDAANAEADLRGFEVITRRDERFERAGLNGDGSERPS